MFIDSEEDTWNMSPIALGKAFEKYPECRIVILVHLFGIPGKIDEIKAICDRHGAVLIEDAAEALGAKYKGHSVGTDGTEYCLLTAIRSLRRPAAVCFLQMMKSVRKKLFSGQRSHAIMPLGISIARQDTITVCLIFVRV